MQTEAFEKLEVKLRHSHAQHGAWCAYCSWRPWADVGNGALRNYLGCFTLCLTAGARELPVTGALGRRKRPLKMLKEQPVYLPRQSIPFFFLFLQYWSCNTLTHTRNHFLPTLCRKPNHLFLTDMCQYPSPGFPLLPVPHTCPSPSWGSHPRTLQASAVSTWDELLPQLTSGEMAFCAAVGLLEKVLKFHFLSCVSDKLATLPGVNQSVTAAGFIICKQHKNTVG